LNFLGKAILFVSVATLFSGCDNRPDKTLSPPAGAKWVEVTFRVPEGITLQPAGLLYRSEQCKSVRYNSSNEPHDIPGYNDIERPFGAPDGNNIRRLRVAVDGGGLCQWQLNSLKVSFRIADNVPLVKGKEVIDTSYIFDFGDYGLSDGYGTGRAKVFSEKTLDLNTDLFPVVFINHMFKKTTLKFFGGDTNYENGADVIGYLIPIVFIYIHWCISISPSYLKVPILLREISMHSILMAVVKIYRIFPRIMTNCCQ